MLAFQKGRLNFVGWIRMFKRVWLIVAAVAGVGIAPMAASAATVLESFNDFPHGPSDSFVSQGFEYKPTKTTNGQCFEALCLQEYSQPDGVITTISRAEDPEEFDFLGFYLNFNGLTETDSYNFLTITDDGSPTATSIGFNLVDDFNTIFAGITGWAIWSVDITGPATTITALTGTDHFSKEANGFFISLGDLFEDVTMVRFFSEGQGTLRIDCAYYNVGSDGGFDAEEFTSCQPSTTVVPVPGGLPLMASAIGLVAILTRRKRLAA